MSVSLTYTSEVIGLAKQLVDTTAQTFTGITSSSFEYVINCIICAEGDISILEKIYNSSYSIRIKPPFSISSMTYKQSTHAHNPESFSPN